MDLTRKIGIGIVMIIPTFVSSGLVWSWVHSWFCVLGNVIIMAVIYYMIISKKLTRIFQNA
jgi:hypothetical protein